MADRKKKRAYLDDFEKDLNGNYRYRGAHYRYAGEIPRGKALARLPMEKAMPGRSFPSCRRESFK